MSCIHVKESILKTLPNIFHHLTPPLFVEHGQIPCHDKIKSKSAIIYVNLCGIYFFRPISFTKKYKLSQFISTYDISEIFYNDSMQFQVITATNSPFIHCEHCNEVINSILSARKLLFKDMKQNSQIQIIGFPIPPASFDLQIPPDVSIATLRYIANCSKNGFIPEGHILTVLNNFNPDTHFTLTLDESCIAPPKVKALLYTIYTLNHIQILQFKNFAPFFVCKLIHHLVKKKFDVNSIILEGYSYIIPEQLRMEKTSRLKPLSFVFKNCNFNDETNNKLFEQLGKYTGEISRISIINCTLSVSSWKSLINTIIQSRSFKELEMFEINKINSNSFNDELVINDIKALLKHCRFIMRLSLPNWTLPIRFCIDNFQNYLLLSEINLSGQNMEQQLPDDFKMLRKIHYLNLSKCSFTFNSLRSLFKMLSTATNPIAVRLSDIKLSKEHWRTLYLSLKSFPPINFLCELDWSGNSIQTEFIDNFANYFFERSKLMYLQIDRIFGPKQGNDLYNLFLLLSKKNIIGISICGSPELNFGGNIKILLRAVELLKNLYILRLDCQKITDIDTSSLLNYLKVQRTLIDVSFDDTCINDEKHFFDFYNDVCSLNIEAVGRPFKDMSRLFNSDIITNSQYDIFKSKIRQKIDLVDDSIHQYYICKFMDSNFDPKLYLWFGECFPISLFNESRFDTFGLKKEKMKQQMLTLCQLSHKNSFQSLQMYHNRYLNNPDSMPLYRIKLDEFKPAFLQDPTNIHCFDYLNKENTYDCDISTNDENIFNSKVLPPSSSTKSNDLDPLYIFSFEKESHEIRIKNDTTFCEIKEIVKNYFLKLKLILSSRITFYDRFNNQLIETERINNKFNSSNNQIIIVLLDPLYTFVVNRKVIWQLRLNEKCTVKDAIKEIGTRLIDVTSCDIQMRIGSNVLKDDDVMFSKKYYENKISIIQLPLLFHFIINNSIKDTPIRFEVSNSTIITFRYIYDNKFIKLHNDNIGFDLFEFGQENSVLPPIERFEIRNESGENQSYDVPFFDIIKKDKQKRIYITLISSSFGKQTESQQIIEKLRIKTKELELQLTRKDKELDELRQANRKLENEIQNMQQNGKSKGIKFLDSKDIKTYETEEEIGSGSSGKVLKVFKKNYFALKIMKVEDMSIEKLRHFINEYEIMNLLNHPNILKTFGIFMSNDETPPSILLEYCHSDLREMIKNKSLSSIELVCCIYQIVEGMKYIHFNKIIHRDLKPSNILVANDGTIKISDFSISKLVTPDTFSMTIGVGTNKFMAPEIISEEDDYNEKVDVYSFGTLLFFMLSGGELPIIKIPQILKGIKAEIPSSFTKFAKELINVCWSFDPNDRPSFNEISKKINENNYLLLELSDYEIKEVKIFVENYLKRIPSYDK